MPKLNTYSSGFQGFPISGGRRANADDFGGQAAEATGEAARTAQKVGESVLVHQEETESRRALVGTTEIRAKYARELDQAAQTGADTAALKEKLDADLAKIGEDFQTTKGQASLDMHAANTHLMFDEQANRIEVQRAAATARMEGQKYMMSSSAILMSNPLYLPAAEQGVDDLMATFARISPQQKAAMALELKQNLNMTAALATARIDPEGTKRKLEGGEWMLTGEQRETAIHRADAEISARRSAEAYARQVAEFERKRVDDVAQDEHFIAIREGRGSIRALLDDARLMPNTREHLVRYMDARTDELANGPKHSNQKVLTDLWTSIYANDDDPKKIINIGPIVAAVARRDLKTTDADKLIAAVKMQKDDNAQAINATIGQMRLNFARSLENTPQFWNLKFEGDAPAVVNEFTAMAAERISAARQANDVAALRDLFNPASKTYIGSSAVMTEAVNRVNARKQEELDAKLPHPQTQAEFDAIKPGDPYIDPDDGKRYIKKAKPAPGRVSEGRIK